MREDIRAFVEAVSRVVPVLEPVVEIGAYQVPGQEDLADLRSLFSGKEYLGCDIVTGPGVDRIEDLHRLSFADGSVGTLIVVETLEHVADPYVAVREIKRVLRPGGLVIITAPFNFPIHHMPDYTRFTPEGMARLLGGFVAQAVFGQGDAQSPHTVCAVALNSATDADTVAFEMMAVRLQNAWNLGTLHDSLVRFEPVVGAVRWDRPERNLGSLTRGRIIEQRFRCPSDGLTRIDLRLSLLASRSEGDLRLEVRDDDQTVLHVIETPARYVWHERWMAFPFPMIVGSEQRLLRLNLQCSDAVAGVTVLASQQERLPDSELIVDGKHQPGTVCFEAFCRRRQEATVPVEHPLVALPGADSSAVVAAARIQAAELRHATASLHAEIEHLRRELADVSGRLDEVGGRVVNEFAGVLRRHWLFRILLGPGGDDPRRQ